jgi:bifunctional DNA-binding transcriptional regulator/antitoxin component of YhaV-PrlF toxin-antitoxin module
MAGVASVKVSKRGQLSLPAAARHRWGLEDGGELGAIDLGTGILLVPGGPRAVQRALADAIGDGRYARAVAEIDDPDLQTQ